MFHYNVQTDVGLRLHYVGLLDKVSVDFHLPFPEWITPQAGVKYNLTSGQTLELKTTTNQDEQIIVIYFDFPHDGEGYFINWKCTDVHYSTWIYVIRHCMTNSWNPYKYLTGVPRDQIKVWQITKTQTSLLVVCNGVTVLDFNFATDYRDGYSNCHNKWTRHSKSIWLSWSIDLTGHLFMRTHGRENSYLNLYLTLQNFLNTMVELKH